MAVTLANEPSREQIQSELLYANWAEGGGVLFAPVGQPFDSLLVAPDGPYNAYVLAIQYERYFVRTQEGHYAKMELQGFGDYEVLFRYVYQDDGSTNLDPTVATKPSTWGRIKSLYR